MTLSAAAAVSAPPVPDELYPFALHPVLILDAAHRLVAANRPAHAALALSPDDLANAPPIPALIPEYFDIAAAAIAARHRGETPCAHATVSTAASELPGLSNRADVSIGVRTEGDQCWFVVQIYPFCDDPLERQTARQGLQQFRALTHLLPVGIVQLDAHWQCIYANDCWYGLTGLERESSTGLGWTKALPAERRAHQLSEMVDALQREFRYKAEFAITTPSGGTVWIELNARALFDAAGELSGVLASFGDITQHMLMQERLRHIAEYDGLTGLANRHLLQNRLEQALLDARRSGLTIVVMFMDLDGFKEVNDTLGHDAGDLLLQQVAQRLRELLRRTDTIARFGGDEFVVLLTNSGESDKPALIARKIIERLAEPFALGARSVAITTSVGISFAAGGDTDGKTLLKQADTALYRAKNEGKNQFCYFDRTLDAKEHWRLELLDTMRRALTSGGFYLTYQPQARVRDNSVVGAECLLRFDHPTLGALSPVDFIPIAEASGLIVPLGRWVLARACETLAAWDLLPGGNALQWLSVNISPRQLSCPDFLEDVRAILADTGVAPQRLLFEITESVLIQNPTATAAVLTELRQLGISIAIDDFGTGYSSLAYLQKFPIQHLKIDRTFMRDMGLEGHNGAITHAIASLARSLGMVVTAEGVEHAAALDELKLMGCEYYQGFYMTEPVPEPLFSQRFLTSAAVN